MPVARILLRNSTDRQARAGTIAAQRGPVRALVERIAPGLPIVEYVEEAVSGAAPLDDRDVMLRLLAEAEPGDPVAAFDMSRLTRSDDWEDRYRVLGRLRRARVRPATVEDGEIDMESLGGRITLHVRAEGAADERKRIRARLDAGKANAAAEGRKPQGATPYGYHYSRELREWSLDEPRAGVVREVFARLLAGETCGQIAQALTAAGAPPVRTAGWTARKVWHLATASTYSGTWSFAGHAIVVPAIVDTSTWQAAQQQLLASGKRGLRRATHIYMLDEGHGRCGLCGAPLRVHWGGLEHRVSYYVCDTRKARRGCDLPWWRTEEVDALLWEEVRRLIERPGLLEEALQERAEVDTSAIDEAGRLAAELDRLAAAREVLTGQFRRGRLTEQELDRELDAIARDREAATRALEQIQARAAAGAAVLADIGTVRARMQALAVGLDELNGSTRRDLARVLAPRVALDREGLRIGLDPLPSALASASCSCTESRCAIEVTVGRRRSA